MTNPSENEEASPQRTPQQEQEKKDESKSEQDEDSSKNSSSSLPKPGYPPPPHRYPHHPQNHYIPQPLFRSASSSGRYPLNYHHPSYSNHPHHQHPYPHPYPYGHSTPYRPVLFPPQPHSSRASSSSCTCKKSKCLKLYCQCFALSEQCKGQCRCTDCHNTVAHAKEIQKARACVLERNPSAFEDKMRFHNPSKPWGYPPQPPLYGDTSPQNPPSQDQHPVTPKSSQRVNRWGCKCKKSFCLKKYCECFQQEVHCGDHCRCTNCHNQPPKSGDDEHSDETMPTTNTTIIENKLPKVSPEKQELPHKPVAVMAKQTKLVESSKQNTDNEPSKATGTESASGVESPTSSPVSKQSTEKLSQEDPLAIMAAVAMTELLAGKRLSSPTTIATTCESNSTESNSKKHPLAVSPDTASIRSKSKERQNPNKRQRWDESPVRKLESPTSQSSNDQNQTKNYVPPKLFHHRSQPQHSMGYHPPFGYHGAAPAYAYGPFPPYYTPYPAPTNYANYSGPQSPTEFPQRRPLNLDHLQSYTETMRVSGLPNSLSFRKICSKCGRTRSEHGELGFGNKCTFRTCGKCGASATLHTRCSMGILCSLTVSQGAIPGAVEEYDALIRKLAERAAQQKQDKKTAKQSVLVT